MSRKISDLKTAAYRGAFLACRALGIEGEIASKIALAACNEVGKMAKDGSKTDVKNPKEVFA